MQYDAQNISFLQNTHKMKAVQAHSNVWCKHATIFMLINKQLQQAHKM